MKETRGRRTHHPTKGNKNKDQLGDKLGDKASGRRADHPRNGNKKGNKLEGGHQREQELNYMHGRHASILPRYVTSSKTKIKNTNTLT